MVITMKSISFFHKQILAALSLATVFAGGCVSVDASVPEIQLVQSNMEFEAVPMEVIRAVGEVSTSQVFSYDHDPFDLPEGMESKVRTVGVSLRANQGIEDFSFLRSMRVAISDGVNPEFELATFEHVESSADNAGEVLVMKVNPDVDTMAVLKSESLGFAIDLTGSLPTVAWSLDVLIDMSGEVQFTL
jgi:hypothetical protein